ncbi:M56 family metallopeptidase [Vallitalea guaymasensis]|uniref:M56 family metallopeptidase n=1 Tax=Vallitalea guaymasensis TaxID=1185412 RepID=UPI002355AFD3|nr:M56 family metallopeptidase [Vallitalea guaymasensis]
MINFTHILFLMSIKTSILVLIILLVKFLFNRLFTAKIHYIIWFLLFISLTIPYLPKSGMSIYNIPKKVFNNIYDSDIQLNQRNISHITDTPSMSEEKQDIQNDESTFNKLDTSLTKTKDDNTLVTILGYIWLFGFLLLSLITIINTLHYCRLINRSQTLIDTDKASLLDKCKKSLGIEKNIILVKTKNFSTPSLAGLFHPKILLPEQILDNFSDEKLELMILHELAHFKRKDLFMNWIILFYQLIYWFNPIIWIGFYKMKNDMEIACDALVLKHLENEQHNTYGKVIIELLEYFNVYSRFVPVCTNILKYKSEVERRIIMIKKYRKKTSYIITIISLSLIAVVAYIFMSTPESSANTTEIPDKAAQATFIINDQNSISSSDAHKIYDTKEETLGNDYTYIYNIIGTPYVRTYFVDSEKLTGDEVSNRASFPNISIYPINNKEESNALYIYIQDNKIIDVRIDEFSGSPNNTWKDYDYIVNAYSYELGTDFDAADIPDIEKATSLTSFREKFLNKSLSDFMNGFNLTHGSNVAYNKKGNLQLDVYPIVSKETPAAQGGLYILSENNIIKNIEIYESDIDFNELAEHFLTDSKNN